MADEQNGTQPEPMRRDYEEKCGKGAMILALLAEQQEDGDQQRDDWHYSFSRYAMEGLDLSCVGLPDSGAHHTPREMLELAAFEAAAVHVFSYWVDCEGMYGEEATAGLDTSRLEALSQQVQDLNREMVLEIGRLLLALKDEPGAEQTEPEQAGLAVVK